ncbi:hypothetical protein Tco_0768499 [Tanacetum coccineum]
MYAPSISEEFRQRVISLLHVGISVETIIQRHNESVDDLITNRHVRTKERNIRRSICELDDDDDVSVYLWVKSNKNIVFFHEEFSDTGPFLLGIQTEWQLQQMIQFGSGRLVALDSRFGTNKLKPVFYHDHYEVLGLTLTFSNGNTPQSIGSAELTFPDDDLGFSAFLDVGLDDVLSMFDDEALVDVVHLEQSFNKDVPWWNNLSVISVAKVLGS